MIFADKLRTLRLKTGWSQEELAERMKVSRQSVSKWESAQSIPDLEKMIRLSQLFGVSTDYLLKDEYDQPDHVGQDEDIPPLPKVGLEEANAFLEMRNRIQKLISLGVFLCIISPIPLFIFGSMGIKGQFGLTEESGGIIGLVALFLLVAVAVADFIYVGFQSDEFKTILSGQFHAEYGLEGMVRDRMSRYKDTYALHNIVGVVLCILAPIPLILGAFFKADELIVSLLVSLLLLMVAIAVFLFLKAGIRWASYKRLLQEGEYSREKLQKDSVLVQIIGGFWMLVAAVYLGYSFATNQWKISWIILVVAGVLTPVITILYSLWSKSKEEN